MVNMFALILHLLNASEGFRSSVCIMLCEFGQHHSPEGSCGCLIPPPPPPPPPPRAPHLESQGCYLYHILISHRLLTVLAFSLLRAKSSFWCILWLTFFLLKVLLLCWLVLSNLRFQCLSRRFLKEFSVPANTMLDGKMFQLFIIVSKIQVRAD